MQSSRPSAPPSRPPPEFIPHHMQQGALQVDAVNSPVFVKGASRVWRIESVSDTRMSRNSRAASSGERSSAQSSVGGSTGASPSLSKLRWEENSDSEESESCPSPTPPISHSASQSSSAWEQLLHRQPPHAAIAAASSVADALLPARGGGSTGNVLSIGVYQ